MKSPTANNFLKVSIDSYYEPQLVSKLLLQVSVRELHNIIVINPEEGGLKEAGYADNNIIIRDYTLRSILPPQLNKMYVWYNAVCGCECEYVPTVRIHLSNYWYS